MLILSDSQGGRGKLILSEHYEKNAHFVTGLKKKKFIKIAEKKITKELQKNTFSPKNFNYFK